MVCQVETNYKELEAVIGEIKSQGDNANEYQKALLKWHKNVDKRYAWVVLVALWFVMAALLGPYRIYSLIFAKVTNGGIYTREEASWPVSMIYTVENFIGPFVSIISYSLTYHQSMSIGGVLCIAANCLTAISSSIYFDVLLLGVVQGIGYAFIFMPFMEIVNNYFIKYRNSALGFALCGGTMSIFALSPLFQYILDTYPWRYAYYGTGLVSCIVVIMVPLLKSNPMPKDDNELESSRKIKDLNEQDDNLSRKLSRLSYRAMTHQNSFRRPSTILISRQSSINGGGEGRLSVRSMSPFASSASLERNISRLIEANHKQNPKESCLSKDNQSDICKFYIASNQELKYETMSINEIGKHSSFNSSSIWAVLKTPAFHLIWYCELMYYWIFTINCLVLVDFAIDRGLTKDESENMLNYQSIGEIVGRLVLTIFVDMRLLSNRNVVILILMLIATLLTAITYVTVYTCLAGLTLAISALVALLYIMLNGLLVDYLGEQQVTLGFGMASCIVGLLLTLRPYAVGFCRDYLGSYDLLMKSLALSCLFGALLWILEPIMNKTAKSSGDSKSKMCEL